MTFPRECGMRPLLDIWPTPLRRLGDNPGQLKLW